MRQRTRSATLALVTAACAVGGGAAAFAIAGGDDPEPALTVEATEPADVPGGPPPSALPRDTPEAIKAAFAVFRRSQRAADRLPAEAVAPMRGNPALARQVVSPASDSTRIYAVPAAVGLCLLTEKGSGGCATNAGAARDGIVGLMECIPSGQILLYGVVPDGVGAVTLTSPDGADVQVPVGSNGWTYTVDPLPATGRPDRLSWRNDAGAHAYPVRYSPDVNLPC